jgi:hypothetical protein
MPLSLTGFTLRPSLRYGGNEVFRRFSPAGLQELVPIVVSIYSSFKKLIVVSLVLVMFLVGAIVVALAIEKNGRDLLTGPKHEYRERYERYEEPEYPGARYQKI